MQIVIDIDEDAYKEIKKIVADGDEMCFMQKLIANGTPISDNATNGDVIKAIFGSDKVFDFIYCVHLRAKVGNWFNEGVVAEFYKDWWNAPYKAESEEE